MLCLRSTSFFAAVCITALPSVASARLPWGGEISRDFAIGFPDGVETVYAVSGVSGDVMTLWAFCPDAQCQGVTTTEDLCAQDPGACDPACEEPCIWRVPTTSPEAQMYTSPGVSWDGKWILFGTKDEKLWGYDTLPAPPVLWEYSRDTQPSLPAAAFNKGFHARPIYHEWDVDGDSLAETKAFLAIGLGNNNKGHLHTIERDGSPLWDPLEFEGAANFLFDPIVDVPCAGCVGEQCTNCCSSCLGPRIYVAADDGTSNTPASIFAFALSDAECPGPDGPPCERWRVSGLGSGHPTRLGGVVVATAQKGRILIATLQNGVVAVHLEDGSGWVEGGVAWEPVQIDQTFRAKPVMSSTDRDPKHPVVYIGQRGSGDCPGAQGRVYRLNPETGKDAVTGGDPNSTPLFPICGDDPIGNVSFSSPVVSPRSGHIFFGPAHAGDPLYKVNPDCLDPADPSCHTQRSIDGDGLPDYSGVGWLDFGPPGGWRTNAAFSRDGKMMHIGSAKGIVYGMDPAEPCGNVRWCYDAKLGAGGECMIDVESLGGNPPVLPACCATLLDSAPAADFAAWDALYADPQAEIDKLEYRRINHTCIACRNEQNLLIPCNTASIVLPSTEESIHFDDIPDTWKDPVAGTVVLDAGYYDAVGTNLLVGAGLPNAPTRTEWMNETTGEIGTLWCTIYGCLDAAVPVPNGVVSDLRVTLIDDLGNEATDVIAIDRTTP